MSFRSVSAIVLVSLLGCGEDARKEIAKDVVSQALSQFKVDKGFHVLDGAAVYLDSNASEGKITRKIPDADSKTFKAIPQPRDARALYAADSKHVYIAMHYHVQKLATADGSSFELLTESGTFARDSKQVFFLGVALENADPMTFTVLEYPFGKDSQRAFAGTIPIPVEDIASWKPLRSGSAEDPWYRSQHDTHPIPHTKLVAFGWSQDLKHIYYGSKSVPDADPTTFVALSDYYGKDTKNVFHAGKVIPEADAATFEFSNKPTGGVIPDAKDSKREYQYGKVHTR